ncbi:HOOK protein-domain-containing protein [Phakopsora pachyrhizi]|nr:HOOK protein-domain-containing protein [Phakopsora pachyrhizi]
MNSSESALLLWLKSLDIPKATATGSNSLSNSQNRSSLELRDQKQEYETGVGEEVGEDFKSLEQVVISGDMLWKVLSSLDSNFFRAPRPSSISGALSEAWVPRFTSYKRMYKLIVRYFEEELRKSMKNFQPVPNLQKIAKDGDLDESVSLCMIILTLATLVQPDVQVPKIQTLPTWAQTALMVGIESVGSQLVSFETIRSPARAKDLNQNDTQEDSNSAHDDSDSVEQLRILQIEKENLQASYDDLVSENKLLNKSNQELNRKLFTIERDLKMTQEELKSVQFDRISSDDRDRDREREDEDEKDQKQQENYMLRSELSTLKVELTDMGLKLDQSEVLNERQTAQIEELKKRLDDLGDVEEQNRGLRDQLDEVSHEIERARKLENVIEKYKKKLDESADLKRQHKALEQQNSDLLDRNTSLEDEYRKVAAFKPLMEQYKSQIVTLESQLSSQKRETDRLQYELDSTTVKLRETEEERNREVEELALYEERVKELEEENPIRHTRRRKSKTNLEVEGDDSTLLDASFERHMEEETGIIQGIGGELNDAIEGRTMTSLKLELRKLKRELKILRSAQDEEDDDDEGGGGGGGKKSRYLLLENLLEDANRMKKKYEDDYLKQYRETLVLSNQLEEIRNGKSVHGDGAEATIALRQLLNETVTELEKLKSEHTELTVAYEQLNNELTLAKSDLHLVGKDQLDMLSSLRESVSTEKIALVNDLNRLKEEQTNLRDQLSMKTEQIQSLLLEKINFQSDSIEQREKMLVRERELSDHQRSKTHNRGEDGSRGDDSERIDRATVFERLIKEKEEECKGLKSKLDKAKLFIMNQDKLYKESMIGTGREGGILPVDVTALNNNFEDLEQSLRSEINNLKETITRLKNQNVELESRYEKEFRLIGSAWHNMGQQKMRETIALSRTDNVQLSSTRSYDSQNNGSRIGIRSGEHRGVGNGANGNGLIRPSSWVKQQRDRMMNQYSLVSFSSHA